MIKIHKGFTIIQLVIGMLIFVILMSIGSNAYNTHILTSNIESVSSTLQIYARNAEDAITDMGFITWDLSETSTAIVKSDVEDYLNEAENVYFLCTFDYDSLVIDNFNSTKYGFSINTYKERDPWGNPYKFIYILENSDCERLIFASAGPDGTWADSTYIENEFSDDIAIVMMKRG